MPEHKRKSQRYFLQLGAAFAVTASMPLSSVVADAASEAEKLSALRAAASSGQLELRLGSADGTSIPDRLQLAQQGFDNSFDNSAPADPPSDSGN